MYKVAILAYNNITLFELGCAADLFALPRPEIKNWYHTEIVSFDPAPKQSTGGISIQTKLIDSLDSYDMLVIPSWPIHVKQIRGNLANEIIRFHALQKRILTFCSGAFLPASLGLLDDCEATTHWKYAARFKRCFPNVNYVGDVLYVYQEPVACSAGSAAALDLGLEIIRRDFGVEQANHIARSLLVSSHRRGGQAQFEELEVVQATNIFSETLRWANDNLEKQLSINDLAIRSNMSRRSFDRKFRDLYNSTPKRWLTEQRLIKAKALLAGEDESIENIAELCGFESAMLMRHHFRKRLNMSPRQYRDQFCVP